MLDDLTNDKGLVIVCAFLLAMTSLVLLGVDGLPIVGNVISGLFGVAVGKSLKQWCIMVEIDDDFKESMFKPDENLETAKRHDITPDSLFAELKAELQAEETKLAQKDGTFMDKRDVIAWGIRQGALEKALKLLSLYPAEKVDHSVTLEDKLRKIHEKRDKED